MTKVLIIVLLGTLGFGAANLVGCAKKVVCPECPTCAPCPSAVQSERRGG